MIVTSDSVDNVISNLQEIVSYFFEVFEINFFKGGKKDSTAVFDVHMNKSNCTNVSTVDRFTWNTSYTDQKCFNGTAKFRLPSRNHLSQGNSLPYQ